VFTCEEYVMVDEINGLAGLNFFQLIILNEKIVKCIIKFGRFMKFYRTS
jgi:hypothetical protein